MADVVIRPFTSEEARSVAAWTYEPPFDFYNGDPGSPALYLDVDENGFGYYAIVKTGNDQPIGFCCFGEEARVQGQAPEDGTVDIGGGVRPDLVSEGLASRVFPAIMEFARDRFAPKRFRTAVASFNERSLRLCASAGFVRVRAFHGPGREFQELVRPASLDRS